MKSKKHNVSAILFYSVILALALVLPNMAFATPVPDTGQTKCYDNTQQIPCPQPGEPFYGQDAQYGTDTHSYTDLENGIVRDNVTGLEWQQATAPGTYTPQQAIGYCNNLSIGGHDDWRLPTIKELSTLVDSSITYPYPGPTINTSYFPDTVTSYYWSSTTYAVYTEYTWYVGFNGGNVGSAYNQRNDFYIRAVRGVPLESPSFIDNGNGTVTDTSTGLMWQKATAPGTYTWEQALTYCENLTLAGHDDWRLPNRNELQSIVDYGRLNPSIKTEFFPDTVGSASAWYCSSTIGATGSTNDSWDVSFYDGIVNWAVIWSGRSDGFYVRAVRDGQGGSFEDSDGDGVSDATDNCPNVYNPDQKDSDGDGLGDKCDADCNDSDGDGLCAASDNCPNVYNPDQQATCHDGIGDACRPDTDGDGIPDVCDNCPNKYNPLQGDSDGDGIGNVCDNDPCYINVGVGSAATELTDTDCNGIADNDEPPTVIELSHFVVTSQSGQVHIAWVTESEINNVGFNIYHSSTENGEYKKINSSLIPAKGSPTQGASYEFTDTNVQNRKTYYYKLEDIDLNGNSTMHGPVSATPRLLTGFGNRD